MILDLTIIGIAIAVDPLPLTAFIVILASQRGVHKGAFFVTGWLLSLAVVVAVTVLATGNNPPKQSTAPSLASLAVKIALGAMLLFIGVRRYRRMGQPRRPKNPPKWQAGVDSMSPWYAMGLAPLTQPWGLIAAGAATVVQAKLSSWADYLSLVYFCLLASASYLFMDIYGALRAEQTQDFLLRLRQWIDSHTDQLIVWGSLIVGCWLIGKSVYLIVS